MVEGKQNKSDSKQEKHHEKNSGVFDNAVNALTKLRTEINTVTHQPAHGHHNEAAKSYLPALHIGDYANKAADIFHSGVSSLANHDSKSTGKTHSQQQAHLFDKLSKGAEHDRKDVSKAASHGVEELAAKTNELFKDATKLTSSKKIDLTPVVLNPVNPNRELPIAVSESTIGTGKGGDKENFDRLLVLASTNITVVEPLTGNAAPSSYEDMANSLIKTVSSGWNHVESEVRGTVYALSGAADRTVAKVDQALGYYNVLSPDSRQNLLTQYEFTKNNLQSAVGIGLGGCRFAGGIGGMLVKGTAIVEDEYNSPEVKQMSGGALSYCVPFLRPVVAIDSAITKRVLVPTAEATSKTYDYYRNNGGVSQLYSDLKKNVSEGSVKMYHHWMNASPMERGLIAGRDLLPNVFIVRDLAKLAEVGYKKLPSVLKGGKVLETAELELSGAVKPEAVKPEAVKPEAVKPEAVKPEAVKPEAVKPEAVKPEAVKPEAVKVEAVKPEAVKVEAVKPEAVKPEAVKPEAPNSDESRIATKPEAGKPEVSKPTAPKTEAPSDTPGDGTNKSRNGKNKQTKASEKQSNENVNSDSSTDSNRSNNKKSQERAEKENKTEQNKNGQDDPFSHLEKQARNFSKCRKTIESSEQYQRHIKDLETIDAAFEKTYACRLSSEQMKALKNTLSPSKFDALERAVAADAAVLRDTTVAADKAVATESFCAKNRLELSELRKALTCKLTEFVKKHDVCEIYKNLDDTRQFSDLRTKFTNANNAVKIIDDFRYLSNTVAASDSSQQADLYRTFRNLTGHKASETVGKLMDNFRQTLTGRKMLAGINDSTHVSKIMEVFEDVTQDIWSKAFPKAPKVMDAKGIEVKPIASLDRDVFAVKGESPELPADLPNALRKPLGDFFKDAARVGKSRYADVIKTDDGMYLARRFDVGNVGGNIKGYLELFDGTGKKVTDDIHFIMVKSESGVFKAVDIKLKPANELFVPLDPAGVNEILADSSWKFTAQKYKDVIIERYLINLRTAEGQMKLNELALSKLQQYGFKNLEDITQWAAKIFNN